MSTDPFVVVYRQDDGQWRWQWSSGRQDGKTLTSAHGLESRTQAESGARSAYPDTRVLVREPPPARRHGPARARRLTERALTTALLCVWVFARARARSRRG